MHVLARSEHVMVPTYSMGLIIQEKIAIYGFWSKILHRSGKRSNWLRGTFTLERTSTCRPAHVRLTPITLIHFFQLSDGFIEERSHHPLPTTSYKQ